MWTARDWRGLITIELSSLHLETLCIVIDKTSAYIDGYPGIADRNRPLMKRGRAFCHGENTEEEIPFTIG